MRPVLQADQIHEDLVPTPSASVYAVEIDGEAVLLDQEANRLHRLNPSATIVWACFDGQSSIRDIAADLADELGLPAEQVLADVLAVTRSLAELGLVEPGDCASSSEEPGVVKPADEPVVATGDPRFVHQPPNP